MAVLAAVWGAPTAVEPLREAPGCTTPPSNTLPRLGLPWRGESAMLPSWPSAAAASCSVASCQAAAAAAGSAPARAMALCLLASGDGPPEASSPDASLGWGATGSISSRCCCRSRAEASGFVNSCTCPMLLAAPPAATPPACDSCSRCCCFCSCWARCAPRPGTANVGACSLSVLHSRSSWAGAGGAAASRSASCRA